MIIFTYFFLLNFSKIFSKTHKIAPFFFNFLGVACPQTPLANAWLGHALHGAKYPHFSKNILNHPPPPRNEILDTPLARYEIISPVFHLPVIKHKFANLQNTHFDTV